MRAPTHRRRVIRQHTPTKITTPTKTSTASKDPQKPASTPTPSCRDLHSFRGKGLNIPIGRVRITTADLLGETRVSRANRDGGRDRTALTCATNVGNLGQGGVMAAHAMILVAAGMLAGSIASGAADTPPASEPPKAHLDATTVEASKDRAAVERRVRTFVNAIAVKPGDESLARWQTQIPLCPLVAGMPKADGEYILARVSKIATAAGAPLAPQNCKANFYIIATADPEGVLKAWSKRDV